MNLEKNSLNYFNIFKRSISTTNILFSRRNPRRFFYTTKGKTRAHDKQHKYTPPGDVLPYTCFIENKQGIFNIYKEAIPELVVPDLTNFKLKPYVSYRVRDVVQKEITPRDLFDACYAKEYTDKCLELFKAGDIETLKKEYQSLLPKEDNKLIE
ncbi:unnamed protein product [Gordionus sp. m RMFG-2023]